jgi:tRNA(Ile)-lysidine synthase
VLAAAGVPSDRPWLVAVSGGLDSVVLLHLLRFGEDAPALVVAHFDHGMRAESHEDAEWVRGLAEGWGLPVRIGRAPNPPTSEADARTMRYEFLGAAREAAGAGVVLTAHQADDQAETVLFRALRGTGPGGLAGIPQRRGHLFRPLLGFWRSELEAYARKVGLSWRDDPTNASLRYARSALRSRVLPDIERWVAPGARRSLVRLAALAREDEAGWASILPTLLGTLAVQQAELAVSVDRSALAAFHPAVRARILRALARRLGARMDEAATRLAARFAESAASGSMLDLGGGLRLRRELDRMWMGVPAPPPPDRPLEIPDRRPGSGCALLAGRTVEVAWGGPEVLGAVGVATFDTEALRFPLSVRARAPGDRIRLAAGSKKVKKVLLEARIPRTERSRVPLVVDAAGDVLWIPGVTRAAPGDAPRDALTIGVS